MNKREKCLADTRRHREYVRKITKLMAYKIIERGEEHDNSKLEQPELKYFIDHQIRVSDLEYGTTEYQESLNALKPALNHHYAANRHHPEHFKNGIKDMNLIDLVEMVADWHSSSKRQNNGNILKSLEVNIKRYSISDELALILENTFKMIDEKSD